MLENISYHAKTPLRFIDSHVLALAGKEAALGGQNWHYADRHNENERENERCRDTILHPVSTIPDAIDGDVASLDHVPIVVHSHLRWDFVWQRPQQIFTRLALDHSIAFIEEPLFDPDSTEVAQVRVGEVDAGIVRVVPVIGVELGFDAQYELLLPHLLHAFAEHPLLADRFRPAVHWFYSPMTVPHFLGRMEKAAEEACAIVYDCMDELASFRFAPRDIGEREQRLIANADVVFTGGHRLYEAKSRHHHNVFFHGCGVDARHYAKARLAKNPIAAEVAALPRPVFGYFGVIDERIDYELLRDLAAAMPSASVVMVGPLAKVDASQLPRLPNIHWLGPRTYAELPALVQGFDVCLMPFALNEATQYINPTKTLEYMAAGKPVVSTAVPDVVRNFTPVVQVAQSSGEFIDAVLRSARYPDAALIDAGIALADSSSWDTIVDRMRGEMIAAIARRVRKRT